MIAALFLITLMVPAAASAASSQTSDVILALEQSLTDALHTRDRNRLEGLLARDYVLRGAPDISRDTWMRNALTLCWGDRSDISDFRVRTLGSSAVASFVLTFHVDPTTCRPALLRSLITDVWTEVDGGWRLLVRHSAPAPAPGAGVASQFGLVPLPPPTLDVKGELSFLAAGGNASTQSFGFATDVAHQAGRSRTRARAAVLTTAADGVTRARTVSATARQGARVRERVEVFGRLEYARDRFAGIEHRSTFEVGSAFPIRLPARHTLTVDAGIGVTSEQRAGAEDLRFATGTGTAAYVWRVAPGTDVRNDLAVTADLQSAGNWRSNNSLTVSLLLTRLLSIKASHAVEYRHFPVPGFGRTDTRGAVALVFGFQQRPAVP